MKSKRQLSSKVEIQTQSLEILTGLCPNRLMIKLWDSMILLKAWMPLMIEGENWKITSNSQRKSIWILLPKQRKLKQGISFMKLMRQTYQ
jgi:hypothetical protein